MKRAVTMVLMLLIGSSCRDDVFYEGDFFFLVNKQAQMPVVVRGNVSSGIFILFLHGGPGGTALQKIGLPAFNTLEEKFATVFWDQRSSGSSQGNSSDTNLTLSQFTEDLDKLVDLIRFRYHDPEIFLMGHSWGGCLGTAYLAHTDRQQKIRGWIEVDGAHNNPMADDLSKIWITRHAQEQIDAGHDAEFWQYALDWYAGHPDFTSDQLEHYAFIEKANGYIFDPAVPRDPVSFPEFSFTYVFESPANVTAALTNYNHVIRNFIISDIDLTDAMRTITIPSLIIWGEHDGIIPYAMATHALSNLGTMESRKSIATLHRSAHTGFYEEPEAFAAHVANFINQYK